MSTHCVRCDFLFFFGFNWFCFFFFVQDIVVELDRKVVKPVSGSIVNRREDNSSSSRRSRFVPRSEVDQDYLRSKLLLRDEHGVDYNILACRKEHTKLLFEPFNTGETGGILERLGLCPYLIDVYAVQPGKKQCVGGPAANKQQDETTKTTNNLHCTCQQQQIANPSVKQETDSVSSPAVNASFPSSSISTTPFSLTTDDVENNSFDQTGKHCVIVIMAINFLLLFRMFW